MSIITTLDDIRFRTCYSFPFTLIITVREQKEVYSAICTLTSLRLELPHYRKQLGGRDTLGSIVTSSI